jgi:hypothetical protein
MGIVILSSAKAVHRSTSADNTGTAFFQNVVGVKRFKPQPAISPVVFLLCACIAAAQMARTQ